MDKWNSSRLFWFYPDYKTKKYEFVHLISDIILIWHIPLTENGSKILVAATILNNTKLFDYALKLKLNITSLITAYRLTSETKNHYVLKKLADMPL